MKQKSRKYWGFTIVELLAVTVIIGLVVPCMIAVYNFMIKSNKDFRIRQSTIQQGYEFFEKLNILMQDYTIDYEEYFNRQMVGCVAGGGTGEYFTWNIGLSGYCTEFTAYGNQNSTNRKIDFNSIISGAYHDIYYCGDEGSDGGNLPVVVKKNECGKCGNKQSFGQYAALFANAGNVAEVNDDEDVGKPLGNDVNAIRDANNIQELYLISHDGKSRLFFRRKLVNQSSGYVQYKIQMLRLRGFDAGQAHSFSGTSQGSYDGKIDTWACDTYMGFNGNGNSVGGAYSEYYLPKDVDDCWVDLTYGNSSVYTRNFTISPLNDPDLYWAEQTRQINPYMRILVVNGVYLPEYANKNSIGSSIMDFKLPMQTTINMKDFYKE